MPTQGFEKAGDIMRQAPTPEQAETTQHVLALAVAWEAGDLDLAAVRTLCTGFERRQAMRCADPTAEGYAALRALLDALVAADRGILATRHGIVLGTERYDPGVKEVTNHAGQRVLLWPLCWIDEEPQYAPVDLPPGEERRQIEEAIDARYRAYRKAKRGDRER